MWGSHAALPITVVPGVSAAAMSAFSVAITDGSSMNTSPARRPARRAQDDVALDVDLGAHRAERVEVRDPAGGGRSRRRRAAASPRARSGRAAARRAGTRRGCALGQRAVERRPRARPRRASTASSLSPRHSTPRAEVLEEVDHRARRRGCAGTLRTTHLLLGEERRGEQGQRGVLVPGRGHGARERDAAFDDELLHELGAPAAASPRWDPRVAPGKRNSHLVGQVRPARPLTCTQSSGVTCSGLASDSGRPESGSRWPGAGSGSTRIGSGATSRRLRIEAIASATTRSPEKDLQFPLQRPPRREWLCDAGLRRIARRVHMFAPTARPRPSDRVSSLRTDVRFGQALPARAAHARCPASHPLVPAARGRLRRRLGGRHGRATGADEPSTPSVAARAWGALAQAGRAARGPDRAGVRALPLPHRQAGDRTTGGRR